MFRRSEKLFRVTPNRPPESPPNGDPAFWCPLPKKSRSLVLKCLLLFLPGPVGPPRFDIQVRCIRKACGVPIPFPFRAGREGVGPLPQTFLSHFAPKIFGILINLCPKVGIFNRFLGVGNCFFGSLCTGPKNSYRATGSNPPPALISNPALHHPPIQSPTQTLVLFVGVRC